MPANNAEAKATAVVEQSPSGTVLAVGGTWRLTEPFPRLDEVMPAEAGGREIRVIPKELGEWDSSLPLFLFQVRAWCRGRKMQMDIQALPDTVKRLFDWIAVSEEHTLGIKPRQSRPHPIARALRRAAAEWKNSTRFVGECLIGTMEVPTSPRQFHWKAFVWEMVDVGPKALPIIGLLSFLIGLTFAYETELQLRNFGLQFYMIGASGDSIFRQIAPVIAAIVLAGRTGAAFAANIANMKLGNEIDALEMLGVSPVNFLVLPRIAALLITIPFTTLYSDFFGILGPLVIAVGKLNIPITEFLVQLKHSTSLSDITVGVIKSFVFAVLIGLAGTLRGLQSERSSAGLGRAVTSAVVTGIAAIIVAEALFAPILQRMGY
jgi:phospholipid/cholesterol/gamma-HCH transport system permease protein